MYRPVVMGRAGLVSAAHPWASLAGLDVLRRGGHAVDAAISVNAVLAVVQPHMCGVGGDFFSLVYVAESGGVEFLNASGRSARAVDRQVLRGRGHGRVPFRGGLPVTVPGCVDGWVTAWERHGRLPWESLFERAIQAASEGFPVSHQLSRWIADQRDVLSDGGALQATFLPDGVPPVPGFVLQQPALAATLRSIAHQGRMSFYGGDLADRLCAGIREAGGSLDQSDLAGHRSEWDVPISTSYRDTTVFTTGANTQGVVALIALNVLEGFSLDAWDERGFERIHHSVEALKLALAARARIGDPAFVDVPWSELLSKDYADGLRARINPAAALPVEQVEPAGDTTAFAVADADGNVVSAIQSLYAPFGAGVMPAGTGVILQNRGAYFSLDGGHPNALEPRKRPLHTLMATIVLRHGRPLLAFGTMGAAGQPQTHVQVITALLDYGLNIQEAIEAPRWLLGELFLGAAARSLQIERRFPGSTLDALEEAGHDVVTVADWAYQMGHAHGILLGQDTGVLMGGADPRGDGYALGW